MFAKETYIERRRILKQSVGSGLLLFLGNGETGMNYADNIYHFRQDSTFLYYFASDYAGLAAIIDIDEDKEIIFGDELTIDDIVWTGVQPTIKEKCEHRPKDRLYIFCHPTEASIKCGCRSFWE